MPPSLTFAPAPVRNLSLADWRSLLDFMSSRIRAAVQSYVLRHSTFSEDSRKSFLDAVVFEMYTATVILSFALMLHPGAISPPPGLRDVFVAMFNGGFEPSTLDGASIGAPGDRDAILTHYIDAWWEEPNVPEQVELHNIVESWKAQKGLMLNPTRHTPPRGLPLSDLTLEGLYDVQSLTRQALGIVETNLEDNLTAMKRVRSALATYELEAKKGQTDGGGSAAR
ncbi:hypothetical protein BKA70DRAFT_1242511 [Coprinopsis sp. MPI-PUGE-AT-0042]|nr:hypothetical protein BKA70DRAFT_1242511 [Coprinopsis sp. MPI-PUGE-AT-0042]